MNHPSTGLFNFGGAYAHYSKSDNPFYLNWDDGDLRKHLWDQIDFGLGSNTLVSKKYIEQFAPDRIGSGNDLPIYRYPEVLLIFAEATSEIENSPNEKAMEALNKVRRRAYGIDPNTPSEIDYKVAEFDRESFRDLVLTERAYEFIFEGKRWLDLKRTGKAQQVIGEARGVTIAERHYWWPIPIEEINFSDAISAESQNPGY